MNNNKKVWPAIILPNHKGEITISNVLEASPGTERDLMIKKWCGSVWLAYGESHQSIADYVKDALGVLWPWE